MKIMRKNIGIIKVIEIQSFFNVIILSRQHIGNYI